jgi:anaerobic selenocysteine-containing dehydrogenase
MSFEHDDIYYGLGHTAITVGSKIIEPYAQCRSNHEVTAAIARRLGATHRGFELSARELVDLTLRDSGLDGIDSISGVGFQERRGEFGQGDYTGPFPNDSGRFRFRPDWQSLGPFAEGMPAQPDHWDSIESASEAHPLRLITPPARMFLNSSFTQSPSSRAHEKEPAVVVHPQDALRFGVADGDVVTIGNQRGELQIRAKCKATALPGTVIVEGVWPNSDFTGGFGVNQLVGADPVAPRGGVAFHDSAVWLRAAQFAG